MSDTDPQPTGVDRDTLARVIADPGKVTPRGRTRDSLGVVVWDEPMPEWQARAVLAHLAAHTPPAPTTRPDGLREAVRRLADWCDEHQESPTTAELRAVAALAAPDPRPDQDGQREAEGQRRAADVYIGTPRPVAETPIRVRTAAEREAWKAARDAAEDQR